MLVHETSLAVAEITLSPAAQPACCPDCMLNWLQVVQVILGSEPGSDGSFDKVNDYAGTINDGAWSVPLPTLVNTCGEVAYVVPAAKSESPALAMWTLVLIV